MAKTNYITNWETWKELCAEWEIDPHEYVDFGIDEGGGNSRDFEYIGDTPKREEESKCQHKHTVALNEEGHTGVYCSDCGEQLEKEC